MNKVIALAFATALAVPFQASASTPSTASWTNWSSSTLGTFMQNSSTVTVTYSGTNLGVDHGAYFYDVPSSFTNVDVTNTPGTNGTIIMVGGTTDVNTFHFSQAVIDPLIDLFSVGQGGVPVSFNFLGPVSFTVGAQGGGHWGGGTLVQAGNSVTGIEGNGLLQFTGSYTDISFTTPNYEFYYGGTVGALSNVNAVPEPETYALMLAGLGAMGLVASRRKPNTKAV